MIIAVDFDGTLVDHVFPEIGEPVAGAFDWLRKFKEAGATLILYTMRADERGNKSVEMFPGERKFLSEAVEFCRRHGVEFDALNRNPTQDEWTSSPKAYAHVYIDDAAFGCPLNPPANGGRCTVNWDVVGPAVLEMIRCGEVEKIIARERQLIEAGLSESSVYGDGDRWPPPNSLLAIAIDLDDLRVLAYEYIVAMGGDGSNDIAERLTLSSFIEWIRQQREPVSDADTNILTFRTEKGADNET